MGCIGFCSRPVPLELLMSRILGEYSRKHKGSPPQNLRTIGFGATARAVKAWLRSGSRKGTHGKFANWSLSKSNCSSASLATDK